MYIEELLITTNEVKVRDSSVISADGKFSMKIAANDAGIYNLRLQNDGYHFATIINDAANITLNADFNKQFDFYNVSGSPASKSILDFLAKISGQQREKFNYYKQADSIRKNNGDSVLAESLLAKSKDVINQMKTFANSEVQKADKASLAFILLANYQGMANDPNYGMYVFTDEEVLEIGRASCRERV